MSTSNVFFPLLLPRRLFPAELACARPRQRHRRGRRRRRRRRGRSSSAACRRRVSGVGRRAAGDGRRARRLRDRCTVLEVSSVIFLPVAGSSCTATATMTNVARASAMSSPNIKSTCRLQDDSALNAHRHPTRRPRRVCATTTRARQCRRPRDATADSRSR